MLTRSFFNVSRRQWLGLSFLILIGVLLVVADRWLRDYATDSQRQLVTWSLGALALFLAAWSNERKNLRSGAYKASSLLRGRRGTVTAACNPRGLIVLDGSIWQAESIDATELSPGDTVFVHGGDGLVLQVSRNAPP